MTPGSRVFSHVVLLALAALPLSRAQAAQSDLVEKRSEMRQAAGQRHLELGIWCRDRGLIPQATAELLAAVELSEGEHRAANTVLSLMRSLDDGFWKREAPRPGRTAVASYAKRAEKAREKDLSERMKFAAWAEKKGHTEAARVEYETLLDRHEGALEFDGRGRLLLEAGKLPEPFSTEVREAAIEINGKLYRRDGFLTSLPDVGALAEVASEALVVRTPAGADTAQQLHDLAIALLPQLEEELVGRPQERLQLFGFETRENWEAWLVGIGSPAMKAMNGIALGHWRAAAVCREGLDEARVQAAVLHELTHLYSYSVTRAVMPSWYEEGLAERFGAQGSFQWDGRNLETRGSMASFRLAHLVDPGARFALSELLRARPADLLASGATMERVLDFYAQSWAFVRFLREGGDKKLRASFADWERLCRGAALGAEIGNRRASNTQPADTLFAELVAKDLAALEKSFFAWLDAELAELP